MSTKYDSGPAIMGELDAKHAIHILPHSWLPWRPSIMSYTASLFSTVVGFPLDSIKTRMQTHHFSGIFDCFKSTVKTEGLRGLFRGVTAPLLSTSFSKSLGVSVFTASKPYASEFQKLVFGTIPIKEGYSKKKQAVILAINNAPISIASGFVAGGTTAFFACPFEFTKLFSQVYFMTQHELGLRPRRTPKTTYQVVKRIRREEGFGGLYSGFRFHFLRDSVGSAIYFGVYETAKILIEGFSDHRGNIPGTIIPVGTVSITTAGALSGVLSWIFVFPIDTVKSLTQRDIVSNIIRSLSLKPRQPILLRKVTLPTRDMYRGLTVSVTRSVITSVAFFSCFEYLMKHVT